MTDKRCDVLKTEFKPDYEKWDSFAKRMGYSYKVLDNGLIQFKINNFNSCMSISMSKTYMKIFFYSINKGRAIGRKAYYLKIVNGKINIAIKDTDKKKPVYISVFNFFSDFSVYLSDLLIKREVDRRYTDKTKFNKNYSFLCKSASLKFRKILKMFMGLNELPWDDWIESPLDNLIIKANYKQCGLDPSIIKTFKSKKLRKLATINKFDKLCKTATGHNSKVIKKYLLTNKNTKTELLKVLKNSFSRGDIEELMLNKNYENLKKLSSYNSGTEVFLKLYGIKKFKHFLNSASFFLPDTLRMLGDNYTKEGFIPAPKNLILKDMHDYYAVLQRKLKEAKISFEKRYEELKHLDNQTIKIQGIEHKILVPKDSYDLLNWGQTLSNCIYSYSKAFYEKNTDLFAVEVENKVTYTLEIRKGQLIQFVGDSNIKVENEISEAVYDYIRNQKDKKENKWAS